MKNAETGEKVAAKVYNKKLRGRGLDTNHEAEILSKLSHPGIVKQLGYADNIKLTYTSGKSRYDNVLFLEYLPEGDFLGLIQEFAPFPEDLALTYFRQMLRIIDYLNANKICHRDIKPENFLLSNDLTLKLCDFGCATTFDKDGDYERCVGTECYLPPELLQKEPYTGQGLDLFACGVVIFLMVFGHRPFKIATKDDTCYSHIINKTYDEFWQIHEKRAKDNKLTVALSKNLKDLLMKMLGSEPSERPTISEIKEHRWYKGEAVADDEIKQRLHELNIQKLMGNNDDVMTWQ